MKLLIAYDGSSCAAQALFDLRRAGLPRGADVVVLSVREHSALAAPPSLASGAGDAYEPSAADLSQPQTLAQQASERLRTLFPTWQVRAEARAGSAASQILAYATTWRPDLIVVGSHGRSAVGRFVLGSVSQRVVTEARCSVRVGRGRLEGEAPGKPLRVVVGLDGSAVGQQMVRALGAREWPSGSEVRVVAAIDPLALFLAMAGAPAASPAEPAQPTPERRVNEAADLLRQAGLSAEGLLLEGDPRHVLVDEAARLDADGLFVGARGLGRLDRLLIGSVSSAVVLHATCSVEVFRPSEAVASAPV